MISSLVKLKRCKPFHHSQTYFFPSYHSSSMLRFSPKKTWRFMSSTSSSSPSEVIGIKLGISNSCAAVMDGSEARLLENSEGFRSTPSMVAFTEEGERLVGVAARRQMDTNVTNTVFGVKRLMGKDISDPEVEKFQKRVSFKIVKSPKDNEAWVEVGGRSYSPAEIQGFVLSQIKSIAEGYYNKPVKRAVIAVPSYFNDAQKAATKEAGKIAGLKVEKIITEPMAALMTYGLEKLQEGSVSKNVFVYDLGGGSLDVTVMTLGNGKMEVKATGREPFLGGDDFDSLIVDFLLQEFEKINKMDISKDALAIQRIREAAEKLKTELTSSLSTEVNLPYIAADAKGPKHLVNKINRTKLELLVDPLIQRTLSPCQTALEQAGIKPNQIDEIILVGGMARMPKIQDVVEKFFGKKANKSVNPDEVIATGAAIQSGVLKGDATNVIIHDVTPLSLGLETNGAIMTTFIPRDSPLPAVKSRIIFTAEDNQTRLELKILQGERTMASNNKNLGSIVIEGIEPKPRGVVQFRVTFSVNTQGMATIKAKNLLTDEITTGEIDPTATGEEIEALVSDHQATWVGDAKRTRLMKLRAETDLLMVHVEKLMWKNKHLFDVWLPEEKEKLLNQMNTTKTLFANPFLEEIPMRRYYNALEEVYSEVWRTAEMGKSRYELYGHDERNETLRPRDMGWMEYLRRSIKQFREVNKEETS